MLLFSKIFLLCLIGNPVISQLPLYTAFETVPQPNVTRMYVILKAYSSESQVLIKFPGNDASADYTSVTWLDPCYREFYTNSANKYVVFWYKDDTVYCEAVSSSFDAKPRFPIENLVRVERLGDRCA